MKYLSIFAIFLACHLGLNAQKVNESSVPEVVKTNFARVVPNTPVIDWEMESGNYEATYKQNDVVNAVSFTSDGKIVHYENTITASELPQSIKEYITNNLAGKKIGNMIRIKTITGSISYKIVAGGDNYYFDRDGKIVGAQD